MRIFALLLILFAVSIDAPAGTTWTLNGFNINSTLNSLTDWNVTATGSTLAPTSANDHYAPAIGNPFAEFLRFVPESPLTSADRIIDSLVNPAGAGCESGGLCGGLLARSISGFVGLVEELDSLFLALSVLALFSLILHLAKRKEHRF